MVSPVRKRRYGISCVVPGRETAPGPGRSAAESTVALYDGGMGKMLTRVKACAAPSVRHPGLIPVSVIVRANPAANAPPVRWRQNLQALAPPLPQVAGAAAQSASVTQDLARLEGEASGPNWVAVPSPVLQKPKNTKLWGPTGPDGSGWSTDVLVCVPVERPNAIGRLPMNAADAGGQS